MYIVLELFYEYRKRWYQVPTFSLSISYYEKVKHILTDIIKFLIISDSQTEDYILIPSKLEGKFPIFVANDYYYFEY